MIGRYKDPGIYRQLLQIKEFYMVSLGILLLVASFLLKKSGYSFYPELLALIVVVILGGPIILEAITGIMRKELNVDELVSLAIIASVIIGAYFSAALVSLIMVLGSLLEEFTAQKARSAIDSLFRLAPEKARIIINGEEKEVPVQEIEPGHRIIIRGGEKVPVDGKVVGGNALLDQASLTGESIALEKTIGDPVYAGTITYSGMLEIEAQKVGEDTTLGKLIALVEEAEKQKAPILRISDHYARYFTPVIIALGLAVFILSKDIYRAITVLIVGCPCAFILASPTAIVSALGNASKNGIMVKGGDILEETSRISAVLFDKTGTLTTGRPRVSQIVSLNGAEGNFILTTAASVERYSNHPLARAIVEAAEQKNLELLTPDHFKDFPGRGVEAVIGDKKYSVGRMQDESFPAHLQSSEPENKTVAVWEDEQPIGLIHLEEEVRPGVDTLVKELQDAGIAKIQMLTGDEQKYAAMIAEKAGIKEIFSEILPEEKLGLVKNLQKNGHKVAMVGDGVNDAPSLATANIGISMGAMGTDAALEAADVALMGDDIKKVPYLLQLGRMTVRTIRFNIVFAVIFNSLALIASSTGLLNPVSGAIAHNIGSILVVLNSARLIK
jgi:Cd2+/Zn2+-exporting ATPase